MKQESITAAEITAEFINAQADEWREAANKANTAAEAYLKDLETRKAALAEQAAGYQTEIDKLTAKHDKLAAKVTDLSSRGRIDEAAEADAELEALDKSISALARKIRLVSAAELKGDPKLYQAAKAAHDAAEAERSPYLVNIKALLQIVRAERARLDRMEKEIGYALDRNPGYNASQTFAKVERHYKELAR